MTPNQSEKPLPTLKKRREFLALRQAPRHSCDLFIVQGTLGPCENEGSQTRVGLTVTKKLGNAVVRNRIKRRLRSALTTAFNQRRAQTTPDNTKNTECGEMVVVARVKTLNAPYPQIVANLTKGIDRIAAKSNKAFQQNPTSKQQPKRQPASARTEISNG